MIQYPMTFRVVSRAQAGIQTNWSSGAVVDNVGSHYALSPVVCAIPPEFEGPGGGYSPEDIYAMALANCFIATFKVFAAKSSLDFGELKVAVDLVVDRDEKAQPWMAKASFDVDLSGVTAGHSDKASRVLDRVSKSCLILNSVRTEKAFSFRVT